MLKPSRSLILTSVGHSVWGLIVEVLTVTSASVHEPGARVPGSKTRSKVSWTTCWASSAATKKRRAAIRNLPPIVRRWTASRTFIDS